MSQDLLVFNFRLLLILGWFFIEPCSLNILLRIFKDSCYCSVINVHSVVLCDSSFSLSHLFHLVKNFFHFLFSKMFFDVAVVFTTGDILSQSLSVVNNFFIFLCRCSVGSYLPVAATLINLPQFSSDVNRLFQKYFRKLCNTFPLLIFAYIGHICPC